MKRCEFVLQHTEECQLLNKLEQAFDASFPTTWPENYLFFSDEMPVGTRLKVIFEELPS